MKNQQQSFLTSKNPPAIQSTRLARSQLSKPSKISHFFFRFSLWEKVRVGRRLCTDIFEMFFNDFSIKVSRPFVPHDPLESFFLSSISIIRWCPSCIGSQTWTKYIKNWRNNFNFLLPSVRGPCRFHQHRLERMMELRTGWTSFGKNRIIISQRWTGQFRE